MGKEHIVILCTCPDHKSAEKIALGLVEERLAACVNIVAGLTSIFPWKGKIERDPEVLMVIKSQSGRYGAIERFIRERHPYEIPEIIALPVVAGSESYLCWVDEWVKSTESS